VMYMGCYGIGVTRLVAAVIEQNHDDKGMLWPTIIAPFQVMVIPINAHKSEAVATTAERLYNELQDAGIEVLLDDRDGVRPGAKFADAELIGIPHRIVVGDRGLDNGVVEYAKRSGDGSEDIAVDTIVTQLIDTIKQELDT
jgi:prolyl-tRNA synthetase